jgi:DNA-binding response OmpR family regulator
MKLDTLCILIVEDELVSTEYLKEILYALHINTIYDAKSASQALDIVKQHQIDLIFMDINIQGSMDGIQCATHINAICFTPIIFTTAYADKNTITEASNTSTFGYVIKPFVPSDIEAALMVALAQMKRLSHEKTSQSISSSKIIHLSSDYSYNLETKTLTHLNIAIKLTKKELQLLDTFCSNLNQNISYAYLKELIWEAKEVSDSAIRDAIFRLKKKIPSLQIENISNYGYILRS